MPRHEAGISGFLDEERAAPAKNIRADHAFDRVENRGMSDQAVQPGEQKMALVAHRPLQHAVRRLVRFEARAEHCGLRGRHHPDRRVVAVLAVVSDCGLGKASHVFLISYMSFIFHI